MTYQPELPWEGAGADRGRLPVKARRARRIPSATRGAGGADVDVARAPRDPGPRGRGPAAETPGAHRAPACDDWRIDEKTRRAGRKGLAAARAALARAHAPAHQGTAA